MIPVNHRPKARLQRSRRRSNRPQRTVLVDFLKYHSLPLVILVTSTLVLFRTWISGRYPGGTDSAFLYSGVVFYQTHGLHFFTVWLPTPFGQVSQYSLYWLLSMLLPVLKNVLFTYDLVAVSIALISAFGLYAISWSWSRSRLGALAAAIFYSFSPFSIAQWLSGHLDVQVSMALGPLIIWCIDQVFDAGSKRAALGLGLSASALLLLTTGQAAYWTLAAAIFVAGKCIINSRDIVATLQRCAPGTILAVVSFAAASAVQLLPWFFGAHAGFAGDQPIAIAALAEHAKHSLPFQSGIIGIPRETWLPLGSNLSFVPFGSLPFILPQIGIIILAFLSVLTRKRSFCLILLILTVVAWLIAAGPSGPIGGIYNFLWQHIIYFRDLRVPNRWLMLSSFAISTMLAISIGAATARFKSLKEAGALSLNRARSRHSFIGRTQHLEHARAVFHTTLLVVIAGSLLILNGGAILAQGLPTITPPRTYARAYLALQQTAGDWRVLTVPFGQTMMAAPAYGDSEGTAADLGYVSSLYTGRSVVGNGGWDPNASQFTTFLADLVNQGVDRHLSGLLGAADIRYVVSNPEAPVQVPWGQTEFLSSQQGLRRVSSGSGITVLENPLAQSQVVQPTSSCVIAGGYPVLEDLTENPSFSFMKTAVYFADQVVETSGWSALVRMVSHNHCLIMGPGAEGELQVLRGSVASAQAVSIAPSKWAWHPIDPLLDSQAGPSGSVRIPTGNQLIWNTAARIAGAYRVWVRIMRQPDAAVASVTVNGVPVGPMSPTFPTTVGYQWLPTRLFHLNGGPLRVVLTGENHGLSPEVAEIALVRGDGKQGVPPGIRRSWLVLDEDALDTTLYPQLAIDWSHPIITSPWNASVGLTAEHGRRSETTLSSTGAVRQVSSLAQAKLPSKINPADPLALKFQGNGSGAMFNLNFFFKGGYRESFSFQDSTEQSRLLFFTPQEGRPAVRPTSQTGIQYRYFSSDLQVPDWNQLERVTLSTTSLIQPGGRIRIAGPFRVQLTHPLPYFVGRLPSALPRSISVPGPRLTTAMVSTTASLERLRRGILDFSQSFDPHWQLTGAETSIHTVELGFENSYFVEKGARHATLTYSLEPVGKVGTIISVFAWCIGLTSLLIWPSCNGIFRRGRGRRGNG